MLPVVPTGHAAAAVSAFQDTAVLQVGAEVGCGGVGPSVGGADGPGVGAAVQKSPIFSFAEFNSVSVDVLKHRYLVRDFQQESEFCH